MPISDEQLKQILEAALMAAGEPLTIDKMLALFVEDKEPPTRDAVKAAIKLIEQESDARGIELKKVSSGYRFQAKKDFSQWVSRLWEEKPARYSRALLETLVLIAYKQPITRGEVEQVRGVAVSTNIIKTLLERDWVKVVGHREVPGRPALYSTTKAFLDYFNLKSLEELPTLAEIRDLETIKPELELDLQQADAEAIAKSNAESGRLAEDAINSELNDDIAETDEPEVPEEEIDVNIEDTDNIRGLTESSNGDDEIVNESLDGNLSDPEVSEKEADVKIIEDTDNIRGLTESSVSEVEIVDESLDGDVHEPEVSEGDSDVKVIEDTDNIRGLTESSASEDEIVNESLLGDMHEPDVPEEETDVNIENTDDIRSLTESSASEDEIVNESLLGEMNEPDVREEETDVNIENTDDIRSLTESSTSEDEIINESLEEAYAEDDEQLETVAVSDDADADEEYSEAGEVDSKFGG